MTDRVFTMFERYSEKARRVIFFARYEASEFGSHTIDTEHLLLGILRESKWPEHYLGVAALGALRERIKKETPVKDKIPTSVDIPFSEPARSALSFGADEAERSCQRRIAPEHLLLGLLRVEQTIAHRVLGELGVKLEEARADVTTWLEGEGRPTDPPAHMWGGMPAAGAEFSRAISDAMDEARRLGSTTVRPEHLLLGLLLNENSLAARLLREAGLDLASLRERLKKEQ